MPVVASLELDDLAALGEAPGETDRRHGRLGTGVAHAHLFHGRHGVDKQLGHAHLEGVGDAKARPVLGSVLHGINHDMWRVPQNRRPPCANVVDVLVVVRVPNRGTFRSHGEKRVPTNSTKRPHR